mmetsp:Transcript_33902/g.60979  ORF Transcript_33902/g.60979 Transcript_33902/m.60979 type:complete len:369 (-) Transcript_33902:38-1144(-)
MTHLTSTCKGKVRLGHLATHFPEHLPGGFVRKALVPPPIQEGAGPRLHGASGTEEIAALGFRVAAAADEAGRAVLTRLRQVAHEEVGEALPHASVSGAGHLQICCSKAWVGHQCLDLGIASSCPVTQCIREDNIGELGLLISGPAGAAEGSPAQLVATQVPTVLLQVRSVHGLLGHGAGPAAMVHHPGLAPQVGCLLQQRPDLGGEKEVGEMVGLHLRVAAVTRGFVLHRHDARVVTKHIQTARSEAPQLLASLSHTGKAHQIAGHQAELAARHGLLQGLQGIIGPGRRPVQHEHNGAELCTDLGANVTCTRGAACDGHSLPIHALQSLAERREMHTGNGCRLAIRCAAANGAHCTKVCRSSQTCWPT